MGLSFCSLQGQQGRDKQDLSVVHMIVQCYSWRSVAYQQQVKHVGSEPCPSAHLPASYIQACCMMLSMGKRL